MSNVRGISLASATMYIQQNYGEEGLNNILDKIDAEDREVIKSKIQPMAWYPVKTFNNLIDTADRIYGKGDYGICQKIGGFIGEQTFSGIYKVFLELGNPDFVIKRASLAWRTLNDTGTLEIEKTGDKYVKGRIIGYEGPDKGFCCALAGYFVKVLEMSGANNIQITETECRCQGKEYCEYEIKWE